MKYTNALVFGTVSCRPLCMVAVTHEFPGIVQHHFSAHCFPRSATFSFETALFTITNVRVLFTTCSVANGVYQNSVYGVAACLPMKYTNAVVLGSVSYIE